MLIKKRKAKASKRGLYIQDKELLKTKFCSNSNFSYYIDLKHNKIIIIPTNQKTNNKISKRKLGEANNPVIDIRSKTVKDCIGKADYLNINILNNKIIVDVIKLSKENELENKLTLELNSKNVLQQVVGINSIKYNSYCNFIKENIKLPLQVCSYFSGAGMMDKAFLDAGFDIIFALEKDENACKTYKYNIGDHIVNSDIKSYDKSNIPSSFIKIGGPPCFGFSNNNRVTNTLDNKNNLLIYDYIQEIKRDKTTKVFVLENVPQILTMGNGFYKNLILKELCEFDITYDILNSADYGDPQIRKRAIFIGSKIGKINLPKKNTFKYKTVRDAFFGLTNKTPNQLDYTKSRKKTIERMNYIPQGGNIKNIPENIRPKGNHSDMYKRLEFNKPSVTIVNPCKSLMTHPVLNRILSVRECARLQGMPDNFIFKGPLSSMQQQVANGTPYRMIKAIARQIKNKIFSFCNSNLSLV